MCADCSEIDQAGRKYVFFDGALSRISVTDWDAASHLKPPFGIEFGEHIESSITKINGNTGIEAIKYRTESEASVAT